MSKKGMSMIKLIKHEDMGRARHGWLDSHHHFSFASYYNPANIQFGVLRVLNDDIVQPGTGFDLHPHENMEIISYVIDGELTHGDSMGNERTLGRGEVQYMSAGTGVWHSEYNHGSAPHRFFQIWFLPDAAGYKPNYGDMRFAWEARVGKWLHIATWDKAADKNGSPTGDTATTPIGIHQDINMYATYLEDGASLPFEVAPDRQAYLVVAEGAALVNGTLVGQRDALEIVGENVTVEAPKSAHIVVIEMAQA
jgi:redox-sensitive bicupin YhaK (pirin superfamily)